MPSCNLPSPMHSPSTTPCSSHHQHERQSVEPLTAARITTATSSLDNVLFTSCEQNNRHQSCFSTQNESITADSAPSMHPTTSHLHQKSELDAFYEEPASPEMVVRNDFDGQMMSATSVEVSSPLFAMPSPCSVFQMEKDHQVYQQDSFDGGYPHHRQRSSHDDTLPPRLNLQPRPRSACVPFEGQNHLHSALPNFTSSPSPRMYNNNDQDRICSSLFVDEDYPMNLAGNNDSDSTVHGGASISNVIVSPHCYFVQSMESLPSGVFLPVIE